MRLTKLRGQVSLPGVEAPDAESKNGAVFLKIRSVRFLPGRIWDNESDILAFLQLHFSSGVFRLISENVGDSAYR